MATSNGWDMQFHFKDGSVYRGNFQAGLRCGQGRIEYAEGATYDGEWRDNKRHGGKYHVWICSKVAKC
jgi:hypothetical protein